MQFDYVSDLHIDHWDKRFVTNTQYGKAKNYPMDWSNARSDILVVAGDISDNIDNSVKYLREIKKHYKKILFVDGNHEHYCIKPSLLDHYYFSEAFRNTKDIHYLPKEDVIIDGTLFIGCCGWWDYDGGKSEITHKNIYHKSKADYDSLVERLQKYEKDDKVKDIVIVTHTVPLPRFVREKETDHNSQMVKINSVRYPKISRWVFGHNHKSYNLIGFGITYLSNPRGRPEDYDRENYTIKTSKGKKGFIDLIQ